MNNNLPPELWDIIFKISTKSLRSDRKRLTKLLAYSHISQSARIGSSWNPFWRRFSSGLRQQDESFSGKMFSLLPLLCTTCTLINQLHKIHPVHARKEVSRMVYPPSSKIRCVSIVSMLNGMRFFERKHLNNLLQSLRRMQVATEFKTSILNTFLFSRTRYYCPV
jgi:hypothetical protein